MTDYLPKTDAELILWMDNWAAVVGAAPTTYGLTTGQFTATSALITAYKTAVANVVSLKDQLKSAVGTKDSGKGTAVGDLRAKGRAIIASSSISDSNKQLAGYKIRDTTPTEITPVAPSDLVVVANGDGSRSLKWSANLNKPGTQYRIEMRDGTSTDWVFVDQQTATRYLHTGQPIGVHTTYRILAKRRNILSGPSNEASVY